MIPCNISSLGADTFRYLPYLQVESEGTYIMPTDIMPCVGDVIGSVVVASGELSNKSIIPFGCRSYAGSTDSWSILMHAATKKILARFGSNTNIQTVAIATGTIYNMTVYSGELRFVVNGGSYYMNTALSNALLPLQIGSINNGGTLETWNPLMRHYSFTYNGTKFYPVISSSGRRGMYAPAAHKFFPLLRL